MGTGHFVLSCWLEIPRLPLATPRRSDHFWFGNSVQQDHLHNCASVKHHSKAFRESIRSRIHFDQDINRQLPLDRLDSTGTGFPSSLATAVRGIMDHEVVALNATAKTEVQAFRSPVR